MNGQQADGLLDWHPAVLVGFYLETTRSGLLVNEYKLRGSNGVPPEQRTFRL
jgi:hypothetical protein